MLSIRQWRMALLAVALLLSIGLMLCILILSGAADPPLAGPLRWQAASPDGWPQIILPAGLTRAQAPVVSSLPFTIVIDAQATNIPPNAIWGLWLADSDSFWYLLITTEGYVSVSRTEQPDWFEFMHIRLHDSNRLYLHITADGDAQARINDELVWTGNLALPGKWGTIHQRDTMMDWEAISLYAR